MRIKNYFKKFTIIALFLFCVNAFSLAQTANLPAPREQKLLNGMKLLVWSDTKAEKSFVKLRIHSGSAFDQQNREGVMALLADILFPNETVKEYFKEDLGGSIEITSNYDYIQISATGDNDKILEILEALANAVSKPQIDKDTTAKVKAAKLAKVKELEKNPAYVADQAVAKRLFGNYPYGRAQLGTTESLTKIDFADILLAKQKFLTADNATLAVRGNVKFDLVYRAARRLFGGWEKADRKVPATFTQPDAPNEKLLSIESPVDYFHGERFAIRGLARNDNNYYASQIFVDIVQNRLANDLTSKHRNSSFARQEAHYLPGIIVYGFTGSMIDEVNVAVETVSTKSPKTVSEVLTRPISEEEFVRSKARVLSDINQKSIVEMWLDVETFKLIPVKDELQKLNNATFADAQKISQNLIKNPMVVVFLDPPPPRLVPDN